MLYTQSLENLITRLSRLPGIGPKSAQRIAFYLLKSSSQEAQKLAEAIVEVKKKIQFCQICYNVTDQKICRFCQDPRREDSLICVVEEARDIVALERTREFKGKYHVLQGAISPMDNIGLKDLRIKELLERIKKNKVNEIVLATNPNIEGEATALYLAKLIKPLGVKVTRIASGLPVGGDLEYADEVTLGRALEGRREM